MAEKISWIGKSPGKRKTKIEEDLDNYYGKRCPDCNEELDWTYGVYNGVRRCSNCHFKAYTKDDLKK